MQRKLLCLLLSLVMVFSLALGVCASEEIEGVQKLTADQDGLVVNEDMLLDLNGYNVTNATVAEGVTLQLMDSANDEYDAFKCGSFSGTINGTVEQVVKHDAKNYLVIKQDGVYSAHRFYAGITHISLVPEQAALGYKAEFHADDVINKMVTGYGYAMWLNSYNPVKYIKEGTIEKKVLSLRVKNILRENNDEMNAIGAAAQIGGKAMIRFEVDGVELTLEGADYVTTLKDAVESVNAFLGTDRTAYTAEKVQAVRALLEKYSSYTNAWEQEYIFTEDKFAAVENVSVTYGDALTLGQVFTAVEGVEIGNVTATVNGEAIAVDANWADTALSLNAGEAVITITDNDRCWTATNTVAVAKANPSYEIPTGLTAIYGDELSSVVLPNGFAWEATGTVGNAGTNTFTVSYTPDDTDNYNVATGIQVTVAVAKADVEAPAVDTLDATYGDLLSKVVLPEGFSWVDNTAAVGNAGTQTHTAIYNAGENYNTVEVTVTVVVAKADIEAPAVDTLDATYGDLLSKVVLPEGFTWVDGTVTVGNAGTQTHKAIYNAGENYNTVEVTVTVVVAKADIEAPAVDTLDATYGDLLSKVVLPEGFTWVDGTVTVGNAGTQTHKAIYNAGENYNTVEVTVTVAVAKADVEAPAVDTLTATYGDLLSKVVLPEGFTWIDGTATVGNAGTQTHKAIYNAGENYNTVEVTVTVVVAKANIEAPAVDTLTATYGDLLSKVVLPEGFTWVDGTVTVGNAGTQTHKAIYNAGENYNTVEVTVTVVVAKADIEAPAVDTLDATYGDLLSKVVLPEGFTWVDGTVTVGNAGTQTHKAIYNAGENYNTVEVTVTVEVAKAASSVTAPTANELTYTGNEQALITAGTATGGTLVYSLDNVTFAETIPTATDATTYTVYYKVSGDANHNDSAVASVKVTIAKAASSVTAPTANVLTYSGNAQALVSAGKAIGGKLVYKVGEGEYSETIPTATNAGTYTVYYMVQEDDNYNGIAENSIFVTIAKANPTYTAPTGLTATYGQTLADVALPSGFTWKDSGLSVGNAGTNSFTAVYSNGDANYNTVEVTVTVEVAKANPTYTVPTGLTATEGDALSTITLEGGFAWKNKDEKVSMDKSEYEATFIPSDTANYNTVDVKIPVAVSEKVKTAVDKFAVALYEGDPAFLYRVGNVNVVKLSSLFKALDNADVGTVSVEIETLGGNVTSVYTANATWTDGTIKFTNTGVVKVTISDEADNTIGNPVSIALEVVDATNVTKYSELGNRNSVLLNDITMSSGGTYVLSGATLYGNGFTFDVTAGAYAGTGQVSGNYLVFLNGNAHLDNVQIIGKVYTTYGAQAADDYNRPVVLSVGNNTITNCYISNCASPVRIRDGNLEIINTTLKGGNFANLDIRGGNVVLDNVTTINQVNGNDTAADGSVVVGLGVVVYYENVLNTTTVTVKNGITQYNVMSEAQANTYIKDTQAKQLTEKIFTVNSVIYNDGTTKWVNAGILSMIDTVGAENITAVSGYASENVDFMGKTGFVRTKIPTAADTTASAPAYVSAGQGPIAPSCSFDYTTKNYVKKTDGSNDYCYEEGGTVMISMDDGDTFNWDTSILAATKLDKTLEYTVSMNGTDYTGKAIVFNQTGKYEVVYTYTDGNNYKLDASGEITTYQMTYTKTVHINVAVVMPDAKQAEFTFGSSNTASKKVTVGNNTYVMPNVSATSSTIGSKDVSGTTVYYPIVEIVMSDNKTSHTSAWYAYFPVFSGAVTITDYAESGTGSAITYGSSTTTMPDGLSLVGDASSIFKYQSSSSAGASPVVKNSILVYSSPSISAKRSEYNTVVEYTYQDNAGYTYHYYIGYHAPAQSYSSICVAPETLVTMADGTQKQIQYVSVGEEVVAWNFYTGKYDVVPVSLLQTHGTDVMDVLYLSFEDGTQLKVLGEHGIYDADLNTFIFIDKDDVRDYVGHSFVQKNGDSYDTVKLVGYEVVQEYTTAYTILSTGHYNVMLENMFTVTPAHVGGNFFNPFEVGDGMKYDEVKVQADIEKYGLYTYEDFDHVLTYEQFEALNLGHFKVSAGKGLITYEGLIYLIQNFVNNEDYNQ